MYNQRLFTVMGIQGFNLYLNNIDETFYHWIYEKCDENE